MFPICQPSFSRNLWNHRRDEIRLFLLIAVWVWNKTSLKSQFDIHGSIHNIAAVRTRMSSVLGSPGLKYFILSLPLICVFDGPTLTQCVYHTPFSLLFFLFLLAPPPNSPSLNVKMLIALKTKQVCWQPLPPVREDQAESQAFYPGNWVLPPSLLLVCVCQSCVIWPNVWPSVPQLMRGCLRVKCTWIIIRELQLQREKGETDVKGLSDQRLCSKCITVHIPVCPLITDFLLFYIAICFMTRFPNKSTNHISGTHKDTLNTWHWGANVRATSEWGFLTNKGRRFQCVPSKGWAHVSKIDFQKRAK